MRTRRSKITNEEIIKDFISIHNLRYDYSKVEYKTMHTKVTIVCKEHGEFRQTPNSHVRGRQGCPKCSFTKNSDKQRDTTRSFIDKAIKVHGDRYDYSKTIYGKNARDKVEVICKEHGIFKITPNSHLSKKTGCMKCSKRHTGWTRSSWKKSCEGKVAKLYILRCFGEDEIFYKIGITNKDKVESRFRNKTLMPYFYEVLKVIESKEDPISIWELERSLLKLHKEFKYKPKILFSGYTECFSKIKI